MAHVASGTSIADGDCLICSRLARARARRRTHAAILHFGVGVRINCRWGGSTWSMPAVVHSGRDLALAGGAGARDGSGCGASRRWGSWYPTERRAMSSYGIQRAAARVRSRQGHPSLVRRTYRGVGVRDVDVSGAGPVVWYFAAMSYGGMRTTWGAHASARNCGSCAALLLRCSLAGHGRSVARSPAYRGAFGAVLTRCWATCCSVAAMLSGGTRTTWGAWRRVWCGAWCGASAMLGLGLDGGSGGFT
ncbi:hypothetical protein B0H17DRAFT_1107653, partial [Mycena rosella]